MGELRLPFFLAAVVLAAVVVLVEVGTGFATSLIGQNPPGLGIPAMALVDGILLFTLALMYASLLVPGRVLGRAQGCLTAIVSLVVVLGAIALILVAIAQVLLMISLIASFFGIVVYLIVWGHFPYQAAAALLALLLVLKLGIGVSLVLAQQRFVQNTGLVAIVLTSLLVNLVVSFLQALPPGVLVSVTDAIAAIIVGVVAVLWAVVLLVSAVIGIVGMIRAAPPAAPVPPVAPGGADG